VDAGDGSDVVPVAVAVVDRGQVVSRDVDIIYFLNNQSLTCPVSLAGWRSRFTTTERFRV